MATGPGRFSIDRLLGWDDNVSGLWWGVGVLAGALVISGATLATRKLARAKLKEAQQSQEQRAA